MNSFPYPVLTEAESPYSDKEFSLKYIDSVFQGDKVKLIFSIVLTSNVLKEYIESNIAYAIIKIQSDLLVKTFPVDIYNGNAIVDIGTEYFRSNDVINCTAFIIAKQNFTYLWNSELQSIYPNDLSIEIRKNDILAISNKERLNYSVVNSDFIKFRSAEEYEGKGFDVKLNNENFIEIVVGPSMAHAYATTKTDAKISSIFSSHIIFESFVFVLIEVFQRKEQYQEKEWFRLFENMVVSVLGENIDELAKKVKDEYLDMNQIFSLAQKLVNNQVEESLIKVGALEG